MEHFTLDIAGDPLDIIRQGAGEPLLLVHGSVSEARTWQRHIEILSESFDVIAPSLRYFGSQPWPDEGSEFGTERHAHDVLELIDALNLSNILCVGWSYGGNVAFHCGIIKPEKFRQFFLYEPATGSLIKNTQKRENATKDRVDMFSRTAELLQTEQPKDVIEKFLDDVTGLPGAYQSMPKETQKICMDNAPTLNLLLKMTPPDITLENFSIPTVIGCGLNTRDFYKTTASELCQQRDSIEIKWIPDANHLWPVLKTDEFCQEIKALKI